MKINSDGNTIIFKSEPNVFSYEKYADKTGKNSTIRELTEEDVEIIENNREELKYIQIENPYNNDTFTRKVLSFIDISGYINLENPNTYLYQICWEHNGVDDEKSVTLPEYEDKYSQFIENI